MEYRNVEMERANLFKKLAKEATEEEANEIFKELADMERSIQEAEEMVVLVEKTRKTLFAEYTPEELPS